MEHALDGVDLRVVEVGESGSRDPEFKFWSVQVSFYAEG